MDTDGDDSDSHQKLSDIQGPYAQNMPFTQTEPLIKVIEEASKPRRIGESKTAVQMSKCEKCHLPIDDKFYLTAMDRNWHISCLKCTKCGAQFGTQTSFFHRHGLLFCKEHHTR